MPIVRKVSTEKERAHFLCSVITAMEYKMRAMVTITVPVISVLFMTLGSLSGKKNPIPVLALETAGRGYVHWFFIITSGIKAFLDYNSSCLHDCSSQNRNSIAPTR
jgi:hypothetical protein